MKYKCTWYLQLPITFALDKEVPISFLIKPEISINFIFTRDEFFNGIEITSEIEAIAGIVVQRTTPESLQFYKSATLAVGPDVNRFYVTLCQLTNNQIQNIFNGEDFIVPHILNVKDDSGNTVGGYDSLNVFTRLTKPKFDKVIKQFENTDLDIIKQLSIDSQNFLWAGLLDMALLNAYVALEVCVKQKFNKSSFSSDIYSSMFSEIKDFKFMEKYLVYGPTLLYQRSLKEEDNELFGKMLELDSLRNKIVHEGTSKGHRALQEKDYSEIYSYIEDIIDDVEDVISWVNALA